MHDQENIEEIVRQIIAVRTKTDEEFITINTKLSDLNMESLETIELTFDLEDRFDIVIPYNANAADKSNLRSVGDIIAQIKVLRRHA